MTPDEQSAMVIERLRGASLLSLARKIARQHDTTVEAIAGPTDRHANAKRVNEARYALWAAIRMQGRFSMEEIGDMFCRDHTTVLYGLRRCGIGSEHPPRRKPMTREVREGLELALQIVLEPKRRRTGKPEDLLRSVQAAKAWLDSL